MTTTLTHRAHDSRSRRSGAGHASTWRGYLLPLMAAGTLGCADSLEIPLANITPIADARVLGMEGHNPSIDFKGGKVMVTLDASHSNDPDGHIVTYRWLSATLAPGHSSGMAGMSGGAAGKAGAGSGASGAPAAGAGGVSAAAGGAGAPAAAGASGSAAGASGSAAGGSGGGTGSGMGSGEPELPGAKARWVPAGADPAWPDDVEKPVVELDQGVYSFTLWVVDDKGKVSDPSIVTITINAPLDPVVQMCVDTVVPTVKRKCSACVCGVSDDCRAAANQSACDANCWGLINCIGSMCPGFMPGGDTSCLLNHCSMYLSAATAATKIGPCITNTCLSSCAAD